MDPVKAFNDSAQSYGIGVAVLLAVIVGLVILLWRLGNRLAAAHELYLQKTADAAERAAVATEHIRTALPTICQADCDGRPRSRPKHQ